MKGVQGNQAAQVRMFAHDAIPVALGAINPENGITLESGGYGYSVGDIINLNTPSSGAAAQLKVTSVGTSSIINVQAVSGGKFYLNGVQGPSITLIRGNTYVFYQKAESNTGHDLEFSLTEGGIPFGPANGVVVTGSTAGVDRVVTFTVPLDLPAATIYYQCATHGYSMGAPVTIRDNGADFFDTYPNNSAVKSFEIIRRAGAKPFGKNYSVDSKTQAVETNPPSAPNAFIGKVANIDLANTSDRGACIYIGEKMGSITAKMESGEEVVFKNISKGSFMPILVKQITAATPDSGGNLDDNDIIALY